MTKQVAIIVTAGVLLVVALYLVTVFSRNVTAGDAADAAGSATAAETGSPVLPPLAPGTADRVAELETRIEILAGEERITAQRDLLNLYLDAGRTDRAAFVQQEIAQALDTPEAWTLAGNLFYGWMQQDQGANKIEAGRQAIAAYQRVLEKDPENLAVRTDMATAYLGTNNPMEGVKQIKMVLEADPNHVQANFNYGIMLSMIGRVDQAIQQFEKVQAIEPERSENYQLAEDAIRALRGRTAQ